MSFSCQNRLSARCVRLGKICFENCSCRPADFWSATNRAAQRFQRFQIALQRAPRPGFGPTRPFWLSNLLPKGSRPGFGQKRSFPNDPRREFQSPSQGPPNGRNWRPKGSLPGFGQKRQFPNDPKREIQGSAEAALINLEPFLAPRAELRRAHPTRPRRGGHQTGG